MAVPSVHFTSVKLSQALKKPLLKTPESARFLLQKGELIFLIMYSEGNTTPATCAKTPVSGLVIPHKLISISLCLCFSINALHLKNDKKKREIISRFLK